MKMKKIVALVTLVISINSSLVFADPPTYDDWEWNRNVTIYKIWGYWDLSDNISFLKFDNGQVCWIEDNEKNLYAIILSMKAMGTSGEFVCEKAITKSVDGLDARRVHRILY